MGRLGGAATTNLGRGARGKGPTEGGHVPGTTDRGEKSNIGACGAPSRPFDLKFGESTGRGRFGPWAKRNGAGGRGGVRRGRSQGGTWKKEAQSKVEMKFGSQLKLQTHRGSLNFLMKLSHFREPEDGGDEWIAIMLPLPLVSA